MNSEFDFYHELLGIPPSEQPPNHYRLLGLATFEDRSTVISRAADKQMRYVRSLNSVQFVDISQRLLNELSTAKICLLNADRKQAYDEELRARLSDAQRKPTAVELTAVKPQQGELLGVAEAATVWMVGSGSECDIVIDSTTVSRRHCRVIQTDRGLFIEDLRSTNGTFVNRKPIDGRRELLPGDYVTLGKTAVLPIPVEAKYSLPRIQVILIGRDPENDVVLDHPTISSHHARMLLLRDRITIEDLGSTNGVAIGNPKNRIAKAAIAVDQLIYLGEFGVQASDLLRQAEEEKRRDRA